MPLADLSPAGGAKLSAWAPVLLLLIIAIGFAAANITLSILVGPGRTGDVKSTTYESGMVPIGNARRRFNVRFYIVAMVFLVFDVDIIFFYPWAAIYAPAIHAASAAGNTNGGGGAAGMMIEMIVFIAILMVAYLYAWGKGVFRWD
jgi:NADH-quinone oxidoreductase subunit A